MEIKTKLNHDKINIPRISSKPNLSKLFKQRKSQNAVPILKKIPNQQDKLPLLDLERQHPMSYLKNIRSDHQQVQKQLEESLLTSSKWRSFNSPIQTPKDRSKQKENILVETLYVKRKQLSAIKVYNHVNNEREISTKNFDEPEFLQFLQEAVSKSTRKPYLMPSNTSPAITLNSKTQRLSRTNKGLEIKQNYTIGEHRKELETLEQWIKSKVQSFQTHEKQGEMMFTDRINFMNMAFFEVSRIVGTFSTETKKLIEYLHKKYYDYYNFLMECMIEQNRKVKAEVSAVEDRLLKTINYYEERLAKFKLESQSKAQKIVMNFQKCIEVKKKLEKENKELKHNLSHEKKKVKFVQEALIKVITLFLALGQKNIHEMTFSLDPSSQNSSFIQNALLLKSSKQILTEEETESERRKLIFQEWCGYLIKMIHRTLVNEICQKEGIDAKTVIFKKQAFDVIKQYMTDNDDSISPADADNILNKFLSTEEDELQIKRDIQGESEIGKDEKEKDLMELQKINKKFENMYSEVSYRLPTFQDVYSRITVHNRECQVNILKDTDNSAVQTFIETIQTGVMVLPRVRSKEVDVSSDFRQRNDIENGVVNFCDVFKVQKEKKIKTNKVIQDNNRHQKKDQREILRKLYAYSSEEQKLSEIAIKLNKKENQRNQIKRESQSQHQAKSKNIGEKTFQQIGVNTTFQKTDRMKTVGFIIPQFEQQQKQYRDALKSDDPSIENNQLLLERKVSEKSSIDLNHFKGSNQSLQCSKNCGSMKRLGKPRRKKGFLIIIDVKKKHLSQKYIKSEKSSSNSSDCSIDSDQQLQNLERKFSKGDESNKNLTKIMQQNSALNKQESFNSLKSRENFYTSLEKQQTNLFKHFSTTEKYQTFEERLMNRSYFKLSKIEYATKQDADIHRMKDHSIRVPKKKIIRDKFMIDPHDFHLELAFKNSEKIKFLTSVTLWPPKLMIEMKNIRKRVTIIKALGEIDIDSMNLFKNYMAYIVNPLLKDFLKSYCQLMKNYKFDFGQISVSNSSNGIKGSTLNKQLSESSLNGFQKLKKASSQLSYNQKLSPLLYNIINFTQYHQNRTSSENQTFFSALKSLRFKNSKMEVYNLLIEGKCVELDILVKTIYQFNLLINTNDMYNPEISYFILESGLIEALEQYFTFSQVEKIFLEAKKFMLAGYQSEPRRRTSLRNDMKREQAKILISRKLEQNAKIGYFDLLLIIFRHIKERQQIQLKKYSIIKEIISRNSECTVYEDIMYFLQCLPISSDKRKKILDNCLKQIVYWNSSEATVPNDIFYFILDKYEIYNSSNRSNQNTDLMKDYIINRCELYLKSTLQKVVKNPEWVVNSTYILSYKIPTIFHRLLHQIRTGKSFRKKKLLNCLLTIMFCGFIDTEMEKRYMPSLFNGILAIPLN